MTVIGRVEYLADIDGKKLPAKARKIGRAAGKEMASEMGNQLDSDFDAALTGYARKWAGRMRSQGAITGNNFTKAMNQIIRSQLSGLADDMAEIFAKKGGIEDFAKGFDSSSEAVQRLRDNVERLNSQNMLTEAQYKTLRSQIDKYETGVRSLREAEADAGLERGRQTLINAELNRSLDQLAANQDFWNERLGENSEAIRENSSLTLLASSNHDKVSKSSDRTTGALDRQSHGWKSLSHNTRQWLLISGAIAAAGEEIAILGSGIGSSLTIAAGALGAFAIGTGVAIAAFQGMMGEISEMPAAMQPAATALQAFTAQFSTLQDAIQIAALQNSAGAFESLRATVESLTPAFELVGAAVGRVLDAFAASVATPTGFQVLYNLIAASAPIFESLSAAAISFGGALGNVFIAAAPFVQIFADYLSRIAGEFAAWSASLEGQNALAEWFSNGMTIMQAIEPLIVAVAQALNDLVTPESIADFVLFVGTMTEFIPILGQILSVIGDLNILNIFAEILLVIGQAIQPIIPELSTMASIIGETLIIAVQGLLPILQAFFEALGPILPVLAAMAAELLLGLMPAITALAPLFAPLSQAILAVLQAVMPLVPVIADLAVTIITGLMPILLPLIQEFANLFTRIAPLMPLIIDLIGAALTPLYITFELVAPILGKLIELFLAIFTPVQALLAPILDLIGGWSGLQGGMSSFRDTISGWADSVIGFIDDVIGTIKQAVDWFNSLFDASARAPSAGSGAGGGGGGGGGMASGGIAAYAQRRLIGEAGSEAVVPLQRPLAQVDPSVRMLAAFAQGKLGGMNLGGGGKQVIFQEGSIVVQTISPDGRLVAESVVDRIAAETEI